MLGGWVLACFENAHLGNNRARKRFAHCRVVLTELLAADGQITHRCTMIPQKWAVGKVTIGGKAMQAALVDRRWNDCLTDAAGLNLKEHPDRFPRGDYLMLAIDGEEVLRPADSWGRRGSARGVLTEYLVLDSGIYKVQAEQSDRGVRLELVPARTPTGNVDLSAMPGSDHVLLIGTKTCVLLRRPPKAVQLPADTYFAPRVDDRATFTVEAGKSVTPELDMPSVRPATADDGRF